MGPKPSTSGPSAFRSCASCALRSQVTCRPRQPRVPGSCASSLLQGQGLLDHVHQVCCKATIKHRCAQGDCECAPSNGVCCTNQQCTHQEAAGRPTTDQFTPSSGYGKTHLLQPGAGEEGRQLC